MKEDAAVQDLLELLRFASVSTDPAYKGQVDACADWIVAKFNAIGLKGEKHATPGHAVVVARNEHKTGRPTVMIYGHYDVQPVDPVALWNSDPFDPQIVDGRIIARGSTDNKGQFLAHMLGAAQEIAENGELPVNVIFLIEGEEEIGSPNLGAFLQREQENLKCDIVAISDTGMVAPGTPTFTYGLRGIAAMEVTVHGPSMDLHSGVFGGAVANPATVLARMLASLHDEQGHIAVEGFYEGVRPVQDWERAAWKKLPLGDDVLVALTGVPAMTGEEGYTTFERTSARPTAEINGFGSGYQGEGTKTIIPSKAMAKLTFRLVPDQDPDGVVDKAEAHLRAHAPGSVRLEIKRGHAGAPYVTDPHSPMGQAAQRALRTTFGGKEPALIREGGSIPIVQTFKDVLGVDTILLGLALPDSRVHSPNENFPIQNFHDGIRLNRALLQELGKGA